ncbi:MAG: hypothetical protein CO141_04490 [Candidatus Moranbacteria bacterium CG_4_9_14_3_um_filter_42_9]|nr:MAG: hypothetical protein CO141_04490 [Candidatus Moranbacteria bacterium CG_4_9_14_3_um_filter_42_9]
MNAYRLSTDFVDLGKHLLNVKTGDLYEVDERCRKIIEQLHKGIFLESSVRNVRFMLDEGILVYPEENNSRDKFHLQWHLLNKCNLRCKHCYDYKNKVSPLTFEQMIRVVDDYVLFIKKLGMDGEISLTGGEPMIFDRLTELVEYIKSRDVFIATYILTNGTIPFSNQHIKLFKDNDIGIQISLDGTKTTNDKIRGKGVYERCLSNLSLLIKNKIRASVHHVIMKKNIDDVPFFISAMDKVGVKRINFSSLVPIGPGAKEQSISPEESKRITEWMIEFQKDVKVSIVGQRPTWALVGSEGFCPVGYKTLTLYADGKFMPCRRLPIIIGDARTDTFFKVWFTSEFLKKNERKRKIC